jgi:hypothetical protein
VVPEDAVCSLSNVTVNGDIEQQSGSTLILRGGVTVNGNISSHGGAVTNLAGLLPGLLNDIAGNIDIDSNNIAADICGSHINGNVAISNTNPGIVLLGDFCPGGGAGGNTIGGNVNITNNNSTSLTVAANTIGKNMSITDNLGTGVKDVLLNKVTGNLTCSGNEQPFTSSGNTARSLIGQCATEAPAIISPSSGFIGTPFTIKVAAGTMQQSDVCLFYLNGTNAALGTPASNVAISSDGSVLTGTVPLSLNPGLYFVTVRASPAGAADFNDLPFQVTP